MNLFKRLFITTILMIFVGEFLIWLCFKSGFYVTLFALGVSISILIYLLFKRTERSLLKDAVFGASEADTDMPLWKFGYKGGFGDSKFDSSFEFDDSEIDLNYTVAEEPDIANDTACKELPTSVK